MNVSETVSRYPRSPINQQTTPQAKASPMVDRERLVIIARTTMARRIASRTG